MESFTRMRLKLKKNYYFTDHSEATVGRDSDNNGPESPKGEDNSALLSGIKLAVSGGKTIKNTLVLIIISFYGRKRS
jgi:hypothetical protein